MVLKIASLAKGKRYSKKYFVYAVDVRTAMSARYVEIALKTCFEEADSAGFTDTNNRCFDFTSLNQFFDSPSIQKTLEYLKSQSIFS